MPTNSLHNGIWQLNSWQNYHITQQPNYQDKIKTDHIIQQLQQMPPLVSTEEIDQLQQFMVEAQKGQRFILHGGDCAERFIDCHSSIVSQKISTLLQMAIILSESFNKPVTLIGRMAGQFAKPRSNAIEIRDGQALPSYRGDLINQPDFNAKARAADPEALSKGYQYAAHTLDNIRAIQQRGLLDLLKAANWQKKFSPGSMKNFFGAKKFIDLMQTMLQDSSAIMPPYLTSFFTMPFFISHEALHLGYEQAFTRQDEKKKWHNLTTHLLWCGMRTAFSGSAHIEYLRGIDNPIAIKIGPAMTSAELIKLIEILDPENKPGRLMLIHRLGNEHIEKLLPPLINAVKNTGRNVLWCCDPMHGNTFTTANGIKTRCFDTIFSEIKKSFCIHYELNSCLGGLHLEVTGEEVTECIGGSFGPEFLQLNSAYKSALDPRLNYQQALELALLVAEMHSEIKVSSANCRKKNMDMNATI